MGLEPWALSYELWAMDFELWALGEARRRATRSSLTAHRSPLIAHRSSLTAHRSPLIAHRSSLTAHRSPKQPGHHHHIVERMRPGRPAEGTYKEDPVEGEAREKAERGGRRSKDRD